MTKHEQEDLIEKLVEIMGVREPKKQGAQWGVLVALAGVLLTIVGSVGTMATSPIWKEINDNKRINIHQDEVMTQNRIDIATLKAK